MYVVQLAPCRLACSFLIPMETARHCQPGLTRRHLFLPQLSLLSSAKCQISYQCNECVLVRAIGRASIMWQTKWMASAGMEAEAERQAGHPEFFARMDATREVIVCYCS